MPPNWGEYRGQLAQVCNLGLSFWQFVAVRRPLPFQQ